MNDKSESSRTLVELLQSRPTEDNSVDVSVVVPAFNEERRLPPTLIDIIDHVESQPLSWEVIVVDDGSSDGTSEVVRKFERLWRHVRLIRTPLNHGKGHAVRTGVLNSRGQIIIFADADGSCPFAEMERLRNCLEQGADVAIGSRAVHSSDTRVVTRWHRKLMGRVFNLCVNRLLLPGISDTQCGFKMFRADAAKFLFERQRAQRYSFDVEILFIARKAGLQVAEVPINWNIVGGSKVNLWVDSLRMLRDIFIFRLRHAGITPADFSKNKE